MENKYLVVIYHGERYSIWSASEPLPNGWSAIGEAQDKQACLEYIEQHWTDMTPVSLR